MPVGGLMAALNRKENSYNIVPFLLGKISHISKHQELNVFRSSCKASHTSLICSENQNILNASVIKVANKDQMSSRLRLHNTL